MLQPVAFTTPVTEVGLIKAAVILMLSRKNPVGVQATLAFVLVGVIKTVAANAATRMLTKIFRLIMFPFRNCNYLLWEVDWFATDWLARQTSTPGVNSIVATWRGVEARRANPAACRSNITRYRRVR